MEKKQTAVDWLESEVKKFNTVVTKEYLLILIEQAKQLGKQQIVDTYKAALSNQYWYKSEEWLNKEAEQYYTDTYVSERSS